MGRKKKSNYLKPHCLLTVSSSGFWLIVLHRSVVLCCSWNRHFLWTRGVLLKTLVSCGQSPEEKRKKYRTVLWAQHSVILNSQQQPMRFSVRVCRVRCRENHRTAPQTVSTILPYTPLLPLSAATVATSALHSPSHMRHLSLETHSGKLVHIQRRQTLCFNPFFFILIWKCDNSFTHNHLAASLLDGDSSVHLW